MESSAETPTRAALGIMHVVVGTAWFVALRRPVTKTWPNKRGFPGLLPRLLTVILCHWQFPACSPRSWEQDEMDKISAELPEATRTISLELGLFAEIDAKQNVKNTAT